MKVIILSGIPGSGKTTYAKSLNNAVICSANDFLDKTSEEVAELNCLKKFAETLAFYHHSKVSYLVVDNPNITALDLAPYVTLSLAYGITPEIFTLYVDYKVAAKRSKVDEDKCRKMDNILRSRELPKNWRVKFRDGYG